MTWEDFGDLQVKMVDLAVSQGPEMQDQLSGVDCLYVDGGNTFYLQYHCTRYTFPVLLDHTE